MKKAHRTIKSDMPQISIVGNAGTSLCLADNRFYRNYQVNRL